jgi:hypothetical protein
MIIYGTRASHIKSVQLEKETCTSCNTKGALLLSTYARYAHVFWIPIFPIGRVSASQCQHCKQLLESDQMPAQIKAYHERNVAETRVPLWQFAGLVLIGIAIAFGVYANQNSKEERAMFFKSPMAGDVYEYKTEEGAYSTFRLSDVATDTVSVNFNNYEVDKISGLYKIEKEENYSDTTYYLSRVQLTEMDSAGEIVDIDRK